MSTNNHIEEWRDVPGYEGFYQVSNLGRVKSVARQVLLGVAGLSRIKERLLKAGTDSSGHSQVTLCKSGKQKMFCIHHLVLIAFVGPKPDGMEARHYPDDDKSNNRLSNLQWGTHAENMHDLSLEVKGHWTPAHLVAKIKELGRAGWTGAKIVRETGVGRTTVHRILHGMRRRHIT